VPALEGVRETVAVGVDGHRASRRSEGDPNGQGDERNERSVTLDPVVQHGPHRATGGAPWECLGGPEPAATVVRFRWSTSSNEPNDESHHQ
jgi:hypothetical protein